MTDATDEGGGRDAGAGGRDEDGGRDEGSAPWLVLIGPAAAGKSTLGAAVASATGRAFADADTVAGPYYAQAGWTFDRVRERVGAVGRVAAEREWEPARAHAVERLTAQRPGSVLALGAGHGSYTDPACRERVAAALARCRHVVFVTPHEDRDEALRVLRERSILDKGSEWICDGHDFLAEWLDDPGTRALATLTLHNGGERPADSAYRLLSLLA